jgi:hypothetical protein
MAEAVRAWTSVVGVQVDKLAIELPQVYHSKIETDQNDLIHLSAVVGSICSTFSDADSIKVYLPAEWKGQAPKDIIHARARKRLDAEEQTKIPTMAKSRKHNMLDGISIGLVFLGRLG